MAMDDQRYMRFQIHNIVFLYMDGIEMHPTHIINNVTIQQD